MHCFAFPNRFLPTSFYPGVKFHDETNSLFFFFFPPSTFCYKRYSLSFSRCSVSGFGYYGLRKIVGLNRTMFVIPANEGSIETWNRGAHGKPRVTGSRASSIRCILIRIVQANRQSVYEPLNFYPIMGLAAT